LDEARKRGRAVGDDAFQLVATDTGLVYCRPSISFAIAARWEEVTLTRPRGDDPVVLPVTWPSHGELKFTVSKRLAGNIFRRWLELRMQAARQARYPVTPATGSPIVAGGPAGGSGFEPAVAFGRGSGARAVAIDTEPGGRAVDTEPAGRVAELEPAGRVVELEPAGRVVELEPAGRVVELEPAGRVVEPEPAERAVVLAGALEDGGSEEVSPVGVEPVGVGGDGRFGSTMVVGSSAGSDSGRQSEPIFPGTDPATPGTIADRDLQRVPRPLPDRSPGWRIGGLRALAGGVAVVSTAVVVVAMGVAAFRTLAPGEPGGQEDPSGPAAIDHTRFRPADAADPGQLTGPGVDDASPPADGAGTAPDAGALPSGAESTAGTDAESTAGTDAGDAAPSPLSAETSSDELLGSAVSLEARAAVSAPLGSTAGGAATVADVSTQARLLACDRNYSGCVPDVTGLDGAPGVDCADRGPGPFFVVEPVVVMGTDIHQLDEDGDGLACEVDPPLDP
jgi:hypothetical protein